MANPPDITSKYNEILAKTYAYTELSKLNPYVDQTNEDILYHLCLGNKSHDLPKMFSDVKFVVMGDTPKRMEQFAYFIMHEIGYKLPSGTILFDISKNSHRYAMFKVGPVISVSHGMGMPSIGILLHELIKLMYYAKVENPTFIRIGTCSGFATPPGTVVITEKVVNANMESIYELSILGNKVEFTCDLSEELIKEFSLLAKSASFPAVVGTTYCTDDFYEGSARTDGAICEHTVEESFDYYRSLQKKCVVNVDMESMAFAALTSRAGIKSVVITAVLCDRLETNQIQQSKEVLKEWQARPNELVAQYIKGKLNVTPGLCPISPSQVTSTIKPNLCAPCCASSKDIGNDPNVPSKLATPNARSCVPAFCPNIWSDSSKSGTPHTSSSSPNASEFGGTWRDCYRKCGTRQETSTSSQQKSAEYPSACKASNTSTNSGCVPGTSTLSTGAFKTFDCAPACATLPTSNSRPRSPEIVTPSTHKTAGCAASCFTPYSKSSSQARDQSKLNQDCYKSCNLESKAGTANKKFSFTNDSDTTNNIIRSPNKSAIKSDAPPTESSHSSKVEGRSSTSACSQKCTSKRISTTGTSIVDNLNQSEISDGCDQKNCGSESEGSSKIQPTKFRTCECYEKCAPTSSSQNGGIKPVSSSSIKDQQGEEKFNKTGPYCLQSEDQESSLSPESCSEQHDYIKERQTQELKATTASPIPPLESEPTQGVFENEVGSCCLPQMKIKSPENRVSVPEESGPCCSGKKDSNNSPEASALPTNSDGAAKISETPNDRTRSSEAALSNREHGYRQTLSELRNDTKASSTGEGSSEASCPWMLSCKKQNKSGIVDSPEAADFTTKRNSFSTINPSSGRNARCSRTYSSCKLNDDSENSSATTDTDGAKQASYSTSEVPKHKAGCPLQFSACRAKRDGVVDSSETPHTSVSKKGSAMDTQPSNANKTVDPFTKNATLPGATEWSGVCCSDTRQSKLLSTGLGSAAANRKPIVIKEDETDDLCTVCRTIQEKRRKADKMFLFGTQSRIIKCPHRLKRLKKEPRARGRDFC